MYIDKNLIYNDQKVDRYVPLTPAAGQAILSHLRANRGLIEGNNDCNRITMAQNRDEASRLFGQCFHKALLLHYGPFELITTRLDNEDLLQDKISCNFSSLIPPTGPGIDLSVLSYVTANHYLDYTQMGKLFEDLVAPGTLLVPAVFNYPVMDFALVGNQTVYIFQLTVAKHMEKVPVTGSSYHNLLGFLCDFDTTNVLRFV